MEAAAMKLAHDNLPTHPPTAGSRVLYMDGRRGFVFDAHAEGGTTTMLVAWDRLPLANEPASWNSGKYDASHDWKTLVPNDEEGATITLRN